MEAKDILFDQPFPLESSTPLPELRMRYHAYGNLNANRDNVIWVCHALTANSSIHDWWAGLFGQGRIFDPARYFIVCANNLGSPYGTSSPDHYHPDTQERYGLNFPEFTLRDTSDAMLKLMDHLDIRGIELLMGGSCGGNIALEIAIERGEFIKNMVLLCCSAKESPWTIAIHHAQRIALETDSTFASNQANTAPQGLKAARAFALPLYRNSVSMNTRQAETDINKLQNFKSASYIAYQGEKFIKRFDAHCYYKLLNALDTHNVGRDRQSVEDALQKIKAKSLVIGIDTDLFVPVAEQQFLAKHIPNAKYAEIVSMYGHDAFLIETDQISEMILENRLLVQLT